MHGFYAGYKFAAHEVEYLMPFTARDMMNYHSHLLLGSGFLKVVKL